MKLDIKEIKDNGAHDERVVLIATEDCDIGRYFAFITKLSEGKIVYNNIKYPFWFPDKLVKKGDLIVLYSGKGTDNFKINTDGTTSYFYYRGLDTSILIGNYITLIVEANNWKVDKTITQ
jgi:hypothetical protein